MLRVELVNMMVTAYEHLTVGYVTGSLAYYYYIYRLEKTPITDRKRSIILSKYATEKLSQFVFKIVVLKWFKYLFYFINQNKFSLNSLWNITLEV